MTAPTTGTLIAIPGGLGAVRATLGHMVSIVRTFKTDVYINQLAIDLTRSCPEKDARCELVALQHFVRDRIKYVHDIEGVETLRTPIQTLKLGAGDCDDKAMLLLALAASIGFKGRFCAVSVDPGEPDNFSHVLAEARLGVGWVPMETIIPGVEIGWFPPDAVCRMLATV